jgi:hypothetical protein
MDSMNFDAISSEVLDDLMNTYVLVEGGDAVAFTDLIRLVVLKEPLAVQLIDRHWDKFEENIVGKVMCFDLLSSPLPLQNYHMISLKMLSNFFAHKAGITHITNPDNLFNLLSFCSFSLDSNHPKVVYYASLFVFNALISYSGDLSLIQEGGKLC